MGRLLKALDHFERSLPPRVNPALRDSPMPADIRRTRLEIHFWGIMKVITLMGAGFFLAQIIGNLTYGGSLFN